MYFAIKMKLINFIKIGLMYHHIITILSLTYLFGGLEMASIKNKCNLDGPLPNTTTDEELYDYFIKKHIL